jgi:hypothetical protein
MRSHVIVFAAFAISACGSSGVQPLGGGMMQSAQHDVRFARSWQLMDQRTPHDSEFLTVFDFKGDGSIVKVKTVNGGGMDYSAGLVLDPTRSVRCGVGSTWRSESSSTLVLEGACSDGNTREIVIDFLSDPSTNTESTTTRTVSVGGATDWTDAPGFGWIFLACSHPECAPN